MLTTVMGSILGIGADPLTSIAYFGLMTKFFTAMSA